MKTHIINIGFHIEHIYKPIAEYGAKKVILVYSKDNEDYIKEDDLKKVDESLKTLSQKAQKLVEAEMKKQQGGCATGNCATDNKKKKEDDDIIDEDLSLKDFNELIQNSHNSDFSSHSRTCSCCYHNSS